MRISGKYLGPDGEDAPTTDFVGHQSRIYYNHDEKGYPPVCSCGWKFNGVFSNRKTAEDMWWDHCREVTGVRLAEDLKRREETRREVQEILDVFIKKK